MKSKGIPQDVKKKVVQIVEEFNKKTFRKDRIGFVPVFKGKHLYLDLDEGGGAKPMCLLTYTGKMDSWGFALFKWSSETYSTDVLWFPGGEYVDGTIDGAMKAGLEAYRV